MPALQCADLQDIASGRLAPQNYQPVVPCVLPPFWGKFCVYFKLKLHIEKIKHTIYDFFEDKNLTAFCQIIQSPLFPHSTCWPNLSPKHTQTTKQERLTLSMTYG